VLTPPLADHILASITRAVVIEVAQAREQACTLEDLAAASEVFIASTTREVQPVAAVDEQSFAQDSPVTAHIAAGVSAAIQSELGS